MRLDNDIKLDFKDVLFRPKRSTLRSRSQVLLGVYVANSRDLRALKGLTNFFPSHASQQYNFQVDLNITYTFLHSKRTWTGVPIMAANMDTVGTFEMAKALYEFGLITCLHKHYQPEEVRWS